MARRPRFSYAPLTGDLYQLSESIFLWIALVTDSDEISSQLASLGIRSGWGVLTAAL